MVLQQERIDDLQREIASLKEGKKKSNRALQHEVRWNYQHLHANTDVKYNLDLRFVPPLIAW